MKYITLPILLFIISCASNKMLREESFIKYFNQNSNISYHNLIEEFGEPTSRSHLFTDETNKDVKKDHAWLHYEIDDKTTIAITVNKGKVGQAYIGRGKTVTPIKRKSQDNTTN